MPANMIQGSLSYGSVAKRFIASLIDGLILSIVGGILSYIVIRYFLARQMFTIMLAAQAGGSGIVDTEDAMTDIMLYTGLLFLLDVILNWLYFAWMESSRGATFGKRAMGLIVTDMEGAQISFLRATGRYFGKLLSGAILMIGYIMAFFTVQRQGLHDILAGTLVLESNAGFARTGGVPELTGLVPAMVPSDDPFASFDEKPSDAPSTMFGGDAQAQPTNAFGLDDFGEPAAKTVTAVQFSSDNSFGNAGPETAADPAMHRAVSSMPASDPSGQNTPSPKPAAPLPPGMKACPSCGISVGRYQTQCMKCGANLKAGIGKKFFKR